MMEDCATSMSAPQGCTDNKAVVDSFKEALKGRVGADRYRMWFTHGVSFSVQSVQRIDREVVAGSSDDDCDGSAPLGDHPTLIVSVRGQFAMDRLKKHFLSEIRGAAMQACGAPAEVRLSLEEPEARQVQLPLEADPSSECDGSPLDAPTSLMVRSSSDAVLVKGAAIKGPAIKKAADEKVASRRGSTRSLSRLIANRANPNSGGRAASPAKAKVASGSGLGGPSQPWLPDVDAAAGKLAAKSRDSSRQAQPTGTANGTVEAKMTSANFVPGPCNRLAHTAMVMACQEPSTASPLFLCGPTGTGKTHLLSAIADQLRRRHRMKRVIHLSAEQFTNDFISSVGNSGITAFRRRYREVDALLVDDVQFLGAKKATLREMLYTVETLAGSGRPLVFAGSQAPTEIDGLTKELAGRLAAGLVCSTQPLDRETREKIFRRWIAERCPMAVPDTLIASINPLLGGDGRVISGVVNVINTLQRMFGRTPTLDELRQYGGQLLRTNQPMTTLGVIESAVCEAFQLPSDSLRSKSQTRAVTGPRMLAMYLSRQLTSAAYAEIARHFGGRSHSTAISAEQNVKLWLDEGGEIGRGRAAMSAREALERVESLLRSG